MREILELGVHSTCRLYSFLLLSKGLGQHISRFLGKARVLCVRLHTEIHSCISDNMLAECKNCFFAFRVLLVEISTNACRSCKRKTFFTQLLSVSFSIFNHRKNHTWRCVRNVIQSNYLIEESIQIHFRNCTVDDQIMLQRACLRQH